MIKSLVGKSMNPSADNSVYVLEHFISQQSVWECISLGTSNLRKGRTQFHVDMFLFAMTGFGHGDLGVDLIPGRFCEKFEIKGVLERA